MAMVSPHSGMFASERDVARTFSTLNARLDLGGWWTSFRTKMHVKMMYFSFLSLLYWNVRNVISITTFSFRARVIALHVS